MLWRRLVSAVSEQARNIMGLKWYAFCGGETAYSLHPLGLLGQRVSM